MIKNCLRCFDALQGIPCPAESHSRRDIQISHRTIPPPDLHHVRFVEVDFPRALRLRLVIEFINGLSFLLEDRSAIPLAAEFVSVFRKHLAAKGGRP